MTRVLGFITHNWPLKVAAVALATLLYGGLVLSQTTESFIGSIPIQRANQASNVIVLSNLGAVTRIRYVAPPDLGLRIDSDSFRASVDLGGVNPTGVPQTLSVHVEAVDDRVQVIEVEPAAILVTLDKVLTKVVPIRAVLGPLPPDLTAGEPTLEAGSASVSGPQSVVSQVIEVQARVSVDASGIDINQLIDLLPVDGTGEPRTPVDVDPSQVRVRVPIFTDRRSKTLPVTPNVVGTPAAGFEVASIEVNPVVISVEGDANDLAGLDRADTQPISISGASSKVVQSVTLALPDGVQALGSSTVQVTVNLRSITATRTFEAGLVVQGASADLRYQLSTDRILVTIGGSVADLDRLSATALVLTVDVTGLEVGTHAVPVSANLTTGLTLISASPNPLDVIVSTPATPPAPTVSPSAPPP